MREKGYISYEPDLGKIDYRKLTLKYQEKKLTIHKRTIINEINSVNNPNYKSKKITKDGYIGDWPFYVPEVVIECREKHWCVVIIDGYEYALNAKAKGRYKLENPHDAGMAILGKSIGEFITMALEL